MFSHSTLRLMPRYCAVSWRRQLFASSHVLTVRLNQQPQQIGQLLQHETREQRDDQQRRHARPIDTAMREQAEPSRAGVDEPALFEEPPVFVGDDMPARHRCRNRPRAVFKRPSSARTV